MDFKRAASITIFMSCLLAAASADRQLSQAAVAADDVGLQCPINPSQVDLDFSQVARTCAGTTICGTCVCSLVTAFNPALRAGGITFNPRVPTSLALDRTASVIRACAESYLASMLVANVDVVALAGLENCTFESTTDVDPCLVQAVAGLISNNTATTSSPAGNPTTVTGAGNNASTTVTATSRDTPAISGGISTTTADPATSNLDAADSPASGPAAAAAAPAAPAKSSAAGAAAAASALGGAMLLAAALML